MIINTKLHYVLYNNCLFLSVCFYKELSVSHQDINEYSFLEIAVIESINIPQKSTYSSRTWYLVWS